MGIFGIIKAIGTTIGLVKKGKEVIDDITGKDNEIETAEDLEHEASKLSESGQKTFIDKMSKEIELYGEKTKRLKAEQGTITPELQSKVGTFTADYITRLRMTTRPWTVRKMVFYICFPVYLAIFDVAQQMIFSWAGFPQNRIFKAFDYCFGKIDGTGHKTLFGEMYMYAFGFVTSIIIGYMGLREIGKYRDGEDGSIKNVLKTGKRLIDKIKGVFRR